MNPDSLLSLFRQAVTVGATYLVSKGLINGADSVTLVSAIVGLANVGWSVYSHWGMMKVPEGSKVIAPATALGFALLLCMGTPGSAADVAVVKARPVVQRAVSFNPNPTGFYVGLGASASVATTEFNGTFPSSTFAAGAGADIFFGYMISADPVSGQFKALEAGFTWRTSKADAVCDPLVGPCQEQSNYSLWQGFKLGGEVSKLLAYLPGGSSGFPGLGNAPVVSTTTHPYLWLSAHEDFVRDTLAGVSANHIKFSPYVGIGVLQQLSPDQVSDTRLECTPPISSMSVGGGTVKQGWGCMARQAIEF